MKYTYNLFIGGCALLAIIFIVLKYFVHIDNLRQQSRVVPINIVNQPSPPPRYETTPLDQPHIEATTTPQHLIHNSPPPNYNRSEIYHR